MLDAKERRNGIYILEKIVPLRKTESLEDSLHKKQTYTKNKYRVVSMKPETTELSQSQL